MRTACYDDDKWETLLLKCKDDNNLTWQNGLSEIDNVLQDLLVIFKGLDAAEISNRFNENREALVEAALVSATIENIEIASSRIKGLKHTVRQPDWQWNSSLKREFSNKVKDLIYFVAKAKEMASRTSAALEADGIAIKYPDQSPQESKLHAGSHVSAANHYGSDPQLLDIRSQLKQHEKFARYFYFDPFPQNCDSYRQAAENLLADQLVGTWILMPDDEGAEACIVYKGNNGISYFAIDQQNDGSLCAYDEGEPISLEECLQNRFHFENGLSNHPRDRLDDQRHPFHKYFYSDVATINYRAKAEALLRDGRNNRWVLTPSGSPAIDVAIRWKKEDGGMENFKVKVDSTGRLCLVGNDKGKIIGSFNGMLEKDFLLNNGFFPICNTLKNDPSVSEFFYDFSEEKSVGDYQAHCEQQIEALFYNKAHGAWAITSAKPSEQAAAYLRFVGRDKKIYSYAINVDAANGSLQYFDGSFLRNLQRGLSSQFDFSKGLSKSVSRNIASSSDRAVSYRLHDRTAAYRSMDRAAAYRPSDEAKAYRPKDRATAYRPTDEAKAYRPKDRATAYRPSDTTATHHPAGRRGSTRRPGESKQFGPTVSFQETAEDASHHKKLVIFLLNGSQAHDTFVNRKSPFLTAVELLKSQGHLVAIADDNFSQAVLEEFLRVAPRFSPELIESLILHGNAIIGEGKNTVFADIIDKANRTEKYNVICSDSDITVVTCNDFCCEMAKMHGYNTLKLSQDICFGDDNQRQWRELAQLSNSSLAEDASSSTASVGFFASSSSYEGGYDNSHYSHGYGHG